MENRVDRGGEVEVYESIEHGHVKRLRERRKGAERARAREAEGGADGDRQDHAPEVRRRGPATQVERSNDVVLPSTAVVRGNHTERDSKKNHEE